ncbi:uncharacterized protein [Haliotis asinina]|uniref:uncharacterized protein n=1 Tax=Haliotis asinina TaxID=109174 RepID=UPI0035325FA0
MGLYTFSMKWHCLYLLATLTCCCYGSDLEVKLQAIQGALSSAIGIVRGDLLSLVSVQCPCAEDCDNVTSFDNITTGACFQCNAQIVNVLIQDLMDQLQELKNMSETECKDCSFVVAADNQLIALNRLNTNLSSKPMTTAGGIVGVDGNVTYFTVPSSGQTNIVTRTCDGKDVVMTPYPSDLRPTGITYGGGPFIITAETSGAGEAGTYLVDGNNFTLLALSVVRQPSYTRNTFYPSSDAGASDSVLVASGINIFSIETVPGGISSVFFDYPYFMITALDFNVNYTKLYFGDDRGRVVVKNMAAGCYKLLIEDQGRPISDLKVDPCTGDVAIVYKEEGLVEFVDPLNGTVKNIVNFASADCPSIAFLRDFTN